VFIAVACSQKLSPSERHLRGNWLAHWQHELGRDDKSNRLLFNQIQLCSFVGHTSAVRQICVLDNENSFISGSQDKTVKLWSVRSSSSGLAKCDSQWTYKAHKKPINDVAFVESNRLIASTDGCLHVGRITFLTVTAMRCRSVVGPIHGRHFARVRLAGNARQRLFGRYHLHQSVRISFASASRRECRGHSTVSSTRLSMGLS
jgi:hypothetical protein